MQRRQLLQYLAAAGPASSLAPAWAQDGGYPSKPVRLIVASAPGALLDSASRLYADRMAAVLKQPVVVDNVAGASSLLAARNVARGDADGYTLLTASNTLVTLPHLNAKAGYAMKEFAPVGEMARSPSILVAGSGTPFTSIADLVAHAKKRPDEITYASGGMGTTSHLPVELFARQAGIKLRHIPYKGISLAVPDVVAGRVDFLMGTPTSLAALIQAKSLRALAITSESRSPKFPEVPTFKELGLTDATYEIWVGVLAPAALPAAVQARLASAMEVARNDAAVKAKLEGMGQSISNVRTPAQFEAVLRADEERYRKLIKEANIVAD
ncbi:MAG TPA: tripartite tricarboxylate transporter substrate binding protein [Ramlibacter sp.]|nr:tripartite tricarboxylate transporter substrate binding protein [Ramlibacter sp.]